jgi:hypothetical protein
MMHPSERRRTQRCAPSLRTARSDAALTPHAIPHITPLAPPNSPQVIAAILREHRADIGLPASGALPGSFALMVADDDGNADTDFPEVRREALGACRIFAVGFMLKLELVNRGKIFGLFSLSPLMRRLGCFTPPPPPRPPPCAG